MELARFAAHLALTLALALSAAACMPSEAGDPRDATPPPASPLASAEPPPLSSSAITGIVQISGAVNTTLDFSAGTSNAAYLCRLDAARLNKPSLPWVIFVADVSGAQPYLFGVSNSASSSDMGTTMLFMLPGLLDGIWYTFSIPVAPTDISVSRPDDKTMKFNASMSDYATGSNTISISGSLSCSGESSSIANKDFEDLMIRTVVGLVDPIEMYARLKDIEPE